MKLPFVYSKPDFLANGDIVFKSNKDAPITTFIDDDSDKSTFISKVKMLILNLIL